MKRIKTLQQFEKQWLKLKTEIISRPSFEDVSEKAKADRRKKGEKDIWTFAGIYFPEYIKSQKASFHKEWDKIRRIKNEPVMIIAARGFGKSTFFTFLSKLYDIVYAKSEYNLIACYIVDKAKIFTGRVFLELKYNQKLKIDFGELFESSLRKSIGYFVVSNQIYNKSICVQAISIGQDPRGLVFGPKRPTSIVLDDIQNRKKAKSKKNVNDNIEWLLLDLLPAMDDDYTCHICASFLNDRCFASTLRKGDEEKDIPKVKTYIYPAEIKNKPAWKEKFDEKRLKKLKEKMGTLNYNQEMLCLPKPLDGRIFEKENMKYYSYADLLDQKFDVVISASDLSMTSKGDYKATGSGALIGGKFYILKCRIRKEKLSSHIKGMYEIYNLTNPERMYYEDVTKKDGNISTVREAFEYVEKETGYPLPCEAVTNNENKYQRIEATLSSMVENQKILFNRDDQDQKTLMEQLYEFPDAENDDGPDMLEMLVRKILEMVKRKTLLPSTKKINRMSKVMEGY